MFFFLLAIVVLLPNVATAYEACGVIRCSEATGMFFEPMPGFLGEGKQVRLQEYGSFVPGDTVIVCAPEVFLETWGAPEVNWDGLLLMRNSIAANRSFDFGCGLIGQTRGSTDNCCYMFFGHWYALRLPPGTPCVISRITGHFAASCGECGAPCIVAERVIPIYEPEDCGWKTIWRSPYR
jgi:hypothetical protein